MWTERYHVHFNGQLAPRPQGLEAQEFLKDGGVQIVLPFGDLGTIQNTIHEIERNDAMLLAREQTLHDPSAVGRRQNWISDVQGSGQIGVLQRSDELPRRHYVAPLPCHYI